MTTYGMVSHNAKFNNPEYIGKTFGRLTVEEISHKKVGKYNYWMWKCRCSCGNVKWFRAGYVSSGHTTSCGCKLKENKTNLKHGESKTRLYHIWLSMHDRCDPYNTAFAFYYRYAGRGISVCDEWHDYETFAKWARETGYSDDLTIERIDNDGNYCPENCAWVDRKEQARNRKTTFTVTYKGREMSLAEACELAKMPYKQVFARIKRLGWPVEKALSIPMNETRKWKKSERFCKILT